MIICAELSDGHGGDGFYHSLRNCKDPSDLFRECCETPQDQTIPDQWQSQILARILMKHSVIFVSPANRKQVLKEMKLDWAPDLNTAVTMAKAKVGENGSITVIPDGVSVIVKS